MTDAERIEEIRHGLERSKAIGLLDKSVYPGSTVDFLLSCVAELEAENKRMKSAAIRMVNYHNVDSETKRGLIYIGQGCPSEHQP